MILAWGVRVLLTWIALGVKHVLNVTAIHNVGATDYPLSDPEYDSESLVFFQEGLTG